MVHLRAVGLFCAKAELGALERHLGGTETKAAESDSEDAPQPGPQRSLHPPGKPGSRAPRWRRGTQAVCFLYQWFCFVWAPLKSGSHGWRHGAHPLLSWVEKIVYIWGRLHKTPGFSRETCAWLQGTEASLSAIGVKVAPPHSAASTLCLQKASLLVIPRPCFALDLSFWSSDIMAVGLGSRAAQCQPVTYPAGVPATPSGQSQRACGFGHPGGPR